MSKVLKVELGDRAYGWMVWENENRNTWISMLRLAMAADADDLAGASLGFQ